jgi:hypothetical protein
MKKLFALAAAAALVSVSGAADAASDGKNRVVTVENISSQALNYLYASPITSKTWEEDLLGSDRVLTRGQSIEANIDNGTNECQYDLKAVMADGREVIRRNINVCAISKWTIGDSGDSIT